MNGEQAMSFKMPATIGKEKNQWNTTTHSSSTNYRLPGSSRRQSARAQRVAGSPSGQFEGPTIPGNLPFCMRIDKTKAEKFVAGDEYVYTPN